MCLSGDKKCFFFFRKMWLAFFSCNTRFEICSFCLMNDELVRYVLFCIFIVITFRLALANTELLRTYMSLHPNILPLLFTLRLFLKSHKLIGRASNQISSYAATIMFLHYLQQKFDLPCLQSCNHHYLEPSFIENWNCNFCKECTLSSSTEKIIENDTGRHFIIFVRFVVN